MLAVPFSVHLHQQCSMSHSVCKVSCVLQGMAGNIIHAIATTNAIIAGFVVIEAIKVLAGAQDQCKVRSRSTLLPLESLVLQYLASLLVHLSHRT